MVGDAYDLTVLLDSVRAVCDDSEEDSDGDLVLGISQDTRRLFVRGFGQLLRVFSAAETAHRAEYALSDPMEFGEVGVLCPFLHVCHADHDFTQPEEENILSYKQLVVARKQLNIASFPAPKKCDYEHAGDVSFVV